ncbi:MAG: hypothetical protein JNM17_35635 [Archangium sp.]|nr:hypothetical protein [Archangium sp.]
MTRWLAIIAVIAGVAHASEGSDAGAQTDWQREQMASEPTGAEPSPPPVPGQAAAPNPGPPPPPLPNQPAPPKPELQATSLLGGRALGHLRVGGHVTLGFPMIDLRIGLGLSDRFDLSVGYSTYYFLSHELLGQLRVELFEAAGFRLMLSVFGGGAFFTQTPQEEERGARWLTGHRNINVSPGILASYQGSHHPRAARFSLEVRYWLAISTQGEALLGHNVVVRGTAELPLSNRVAFLLSFGLDVHGRAEDSIVMPSSTLGISLNF